MGLLLSASYVVHVASAVLFVVYAFLPAARAGDLDAGTFEVRLQKLLLLTRWTGVVLPATGLYQAWVLYPLPRLFGTTQGYLVLAMAVLWTLMNGLVEFGVLAARTVEDELGLGTYFAAGVRADGGLPAGTVQSGARAARPYFLGATALAVLLVVDAALLAGSVPAALVP